MINLTHYHCPHTSGTKDYDIYLLESTNTKMSVLIKRWGKVGANGQSKAEVAKNGSTALDKALDERRKSGGYMPKREHNSQYASVNQAMLYLPAHLRSAVSNAQLSQLDPVNFSKTDRSAFNPMADETEKLRREMQRKAEEEAAAQQKAEQAAESDALKSNPLFGMF